MYVILLYVIDFGHIVDTTSRCEYFPQQCLLCNLLYLKSCLVELAKKKRNPIKSFFFLHIRIFERKNINGACKNKEFEQLKDETIRFLGEKREIRFMGTTFFPSEMTTMCSLWMVKGRRLRFVQMAANDNQISVAHRQRKSTIFQHQSCLVSNNHISSNRIYQLHLLNHRLRWHSSMALAHRHWRLLQPLQGTCNAHPLCLIRDQTIAQTLRPTHTTATAATPIVVMWTKIIIR